MATAHEGELAPRLLERETEEEALRRLLACTGRDDGGVLLVEGAAGIGKTSLLMEAARLARDRGYRVMLARGAELEREFAYGAVRQLYEPLLGESRLARENADVAAVLFDSAGAVGSAGAVSAFQLMHALYWWTVRLADAGPVVLAVDDAQWLDVPSLRFLGFWLDGWRALRSPCSSHSGRRRGPSSANWSRISTSVRGRCGSSHRRWARTRYAGC